MGKLVVGGTRCVMMQMHEEQNIFSFYLWSEVIVVGWCIGFVVVGIHVMSDTFFGSNLSLCGTIVVF